MMRVHHQIERLASKTLPLLLAGLVACGPVATQTCRDDSECQGGACVNGRCRPIAGPDGGESARDGSAVGDAAIASDLARAPNVDGGVDATSLDAAPGCRFNGNGAIEREEAFFLIGLGALYVTGAAGATVPVDLKAKNGVWDFSAPVANERKLFDQLVDPRGAWWEKSFPKATHAQRLDDTQAVLGVYQATNDSLLLLGVVSEQGGLSRTELSYNPPVPVLKFPLAVYQAWAETSTVSGVAMGIGFVATEKYEFLVDGRGMTKVPAGAFDALRMRLHYTQTYGLLTTKRTSFLYIAECYGAVARVRSRDNEMSDDFTMASEYRRLSAP